MNVERSLNLDQEAKNLIKGFLVTPKITFFISGPEFRGLDYSGQQYSREQVEKHAISMLKDFAGPIRVFEVKNGEAKEIFNTANHSRKVAEEARNAKRRRINIHSREEKNTHWY